MDHTSPKRYFEHNFIYSLTEAKSRKYKGVFMVKSRVKTWQVRGILSQQLEHKQVPKRGTEPGVQKGKRSLLASHTCCKCSMETTHNSVKAELSCDFSATSIDCYEFDRVAVIEHL